MRRIGQTRRVIFLDNNLTMDSLIQYRDRNVHIVGVAGTEGFAILEFLLRHGFHRLTVHNLSGGEALRDAFLAAHVALPAQERTQALQRLLTAPVRHCTGPDYLDGILSADLIFTTQNWFAHPANDPLKHARDSGIPLRFLTQLYLALSPVPVVAVTGTNGKTTVTTCLSHLLSTAGIPCLMSGNDRYHPQVINNLVSIPPNGALVLEISNRQLRELNRGPQIAVLTNIRPDHVDEHGSFEAYRAIKASLFNLVPPTGWSILNADDPSTPDIAKTIHSNILSYGLQEPLQPGHAGIINDRCCIMDDDRRVHVLFNIEDPQIPGHHNLLNCMAAAVTAYVMGANPVAISQGIRSFQGVRHRMERLAEIDGIRFFDDEASTNPQATKAALESMDRSIVLICGGDVKGNESDYAVLRPLLIDRVRAVIRLPGRAGELIRDMADDIPVFPVEDLIEAMACADNQLRSGDALLLSPAGAGFHSRYNSGRKGYRRLVRDRIRRSRKTAGHPDSIAETDE